MKTKALRDIKRPIEIGYYTNLPSPRINWNFSSPISGSRKKIKRALQHDLLQLDSVISDHSLENSSEFSFSKYLKILKTFKLISSNILNKEEEELVTKTWHAISFYSNGNIVTNVENIKVFLTGIMGTPEPWMHKNHKI